MVSYFNGIKTTEEKIFDGLKSEKDIEEAGAYYFGLYAEAPKVYKVPKETELDIPDLYRSTKKYRTTLGHKANHKFVNNVEFEILNHPVFGVIACLVAVVDIDVGEELFAHYNYDLDNAAEWYRKLYRDGDYDD